MTGDRSDDAGDELEARARELQRHLEATAELPLDREANRWLGEAEAVATDAATSDLESAVVRDRVAKVRGLLAEVDGTGTDEGDERLEAARDCCEAILEEE